MKGVNMKGVWLDRSEHNDYLWAECSNCKVSYGCLDTPYCPNCGRKMTGFKNSEEI